MRCAYHAIVPQFCHARNTNDPVPATPSVKRQRKPAAPKGKAKAAAAAVDKDEGVKSDTE